MTSSPRTGMSMDLFAIVPAEPGGVRAAAHVVGAVPAHDGHRLVGAAIRLDGHDRPARLELALVVVGLVLGDAGPGQGADQPADPGADRGIGEDDAQGAAGDRRPDHGDDPREHPEARQRTQAQAGHDARRPRPSRLAIRPRRSRRSRHRPRDAPGVVSHRDADLIVPEPSPAEFVNRSIGLQTVVEDTDDGRLVSHHVVLLAEPREAARRRRSERPVLRRWVHRGAQVQTRCRPARAGRRRTADLFLLTSAGRAVVRLGRV